VNKYKKVTCSSVYFEVRGQPCVRLGNFSSVLNEAKVSSPLGLVISICWLHITYIISWCVEINLAKPVEVILPNKYSGCSTEIDGRD
jgi:hypothetical protein